MKILVAIKRVIDHKVRVRLNDAGEVETGSVKMSINPFDEVALEQAIRLREAGIASEIIVVSIGGKKCEDIIRHAYAMGADRAIHLVTDQNLHSYDIAKILSGIMRDEAPQLVLLGKQAIDTDAGIVGASLAAILDYPHIGFASNIEICGETINVTRDIELGQDVYNAKMPAIISVDLTLCHARFIKLPQIMKARAKKIDTRQLEYSPQNYITRTSIEAVTVERKSIRVESIAEFKQLIEAAK